MGTEERERKKIIAMRNTSFLMRKCVFHTSNLVATLQ